MPETFQPRQRRVKRDLAAEFKLSRTLIREATRKLATIRTVRFIPNQGGTGPDFSLEDIESS